MEANEATQTHCYNPVVLAYPIWAYYAHGRQRRCQEDPVSLPSGRLEKTTRSSPHHVAQSAPSNRIGNTNLRSPKQHCSRFGSEPPSIEHDVDVWCYAIVSCMPETTSHKHHPRCHAKHILCCHIYIYFTQYHFQTSNLPSSIQCPCSTDYSMIKHKVHQACS